MVMYIGYRNADNKVSESVWYVGSDKPANISSNKVVSIQADGHELEYIKINYINIPLVSDMRVLNWNGEFARFIFHHLRK